MAPGEGVNAEVFPRDGEVSLRLMRDDSADYAQMRAWLNTPHVHEWWDPDLPPYTDERVVDEYRSMTRGESDTTPCFITIGDEDAGFIQYYRWADDATYQSQIGLRL